MRGQPKFVYETIHRLRDPLTVCRGHLQMLGEVAADQRGTVALVTDELDRMAGMLADLELLANVEHQDFLRPEWIDLELFAHELTAKASELAPRNWRLDEADSGTLFADRRHVCEAMMNLARNASEHTTPDETIAIAASVNDGECRLSVRDTGTGISASDRERIFEPFERGADAHRRYRGGGLGLAIVKAIAEAHGGRVEVESRLGEGSTFTLVLPRERSD